MNGLGWGLFWAIAAPSFVLGGVLGLLCGVYWAYEAGVAYGRALGLTSDYQTLRGEAEAQYRKTRALL